jgi:hypothetical protein
MDSVQEHSPFAPLRQKDLENILISFPEVGELLQEAIRDKSASFCHEHSGQDEACQTTWRLHAALLDIMLEPLTAIFSEASDVAAAEAFYINGASELELAFRGEARDAYVWLQCVLAEDIRFQCPSKCIRMQDMARF